MKHSNVLPRMQFGEHGHQSFGGVLTVIAWILGLWFSAAFVGGTKGLFDQPGTPPIALGLFILIPVTGFVLAYRASERMRRALDTLPLWGITLFHVIRLVGLGFVFGAVERLLPPQFGYPAGVGDFVAALLSLPLALALHQPEDWPRLRIAFMAWNIFGLLDLVLAVSLGILYSPSSFGLLRSGISTELMARFPVNLIPTFIVPVLILLHLLALKRNRELSGKTSEDMPEGKVGAGGRR